MIAWIVLPPQYPFMLLEARKRPALEHLYARYGRRLLRRSFARVWVGGESWPDGDGPSIGFLNHSAWWDPILTLFLSHDLFRRDGYGIMQGAQLQRYPFFRRIGCFGATGDSFEDARTVSLYAGRVLHEGARRTLWIFPQGELLPARVPLAFRSGAARFARTAPEAPLVPVAVRYEFRAEQRPEAFVRVGEAVRADSARSGGAGDAGSSTRDGVLRLTRRLEQRLRQELATLDDDLARATRPATSALPAHSLSDAGYRVVLEGASSLSSLYDRTLGRLPTLRRRRA